MHILFKGGHVGVYVIVSLATRQYVDGVYKPAAIEVVGKILKPVIIQEVGIKCGRSQFYKDHVIPEFGAFDVAVIFESV